MDKIGMSETERGKLQQQVDLMIGKTYKYKGNRVYIEDVRVKGDTITFETEGADIRIDIYELEEELCEFKQTDAPVLARNVRIINMITDNSLYSTVQATLMNSIQKIQEDKKYIQQAQAVNETIKNIIELEKVRISAFALLK